MIILIGYFLYGEKVFKLKELLLISDTNNSFIRVLSRLEGRGLFGASSAQIPILSHLLNQVIFAIYIDSLFNVEI